MIVMSLLEVGEDLETLRSTIMKDLKINKMD